MKLTFERETFGQVLGDMLDVLVRSGVLTPGDIGKQAVPRYTEAPGETAAVDVTQGPSPEPQGPVESGADSNPKKSKEPQKKPKDKLKKAKTAEPEAEAEADGPEVATPEPEVADAFSPADLIAIRQKTIEDLQAAYSGGKQKVVFDLLAKHGNGAKSFRELAADAFLPIRKAIDEGALA